MLYADGPTIFLSTLSLRRATAPVDRMPSSSEFLSTLSLRRATIRFAGAASAPNNFYPRSPCGERRLTYRRTRRFPDISIHALLAESDTPRLSRVVPTPIFLSTLSLRRATGLGRGPERGYVHFYPRSPCGERLFTHFRNKVPCRFLSTLSLRRATLVPHQQKCSDGISIHALLAESDINTSL